MIRANVQITHRIMRFSSAKRGALSAATAFSLSFHVILPVLLPGTGTDAIAQQRAEHTISGYVSDASNGEKLIGASLYEPTLRVGATTNRYGFFSLTLPADSLLIVVSYIGFHSDTLSIRPERDIRVEFALKPLPLEMQGIEVKAEQADPIQEQTRMGVVDVPVSQIENAPALLGEVDLMKTMQLLPGVQSGAEGTSGLYVRGGGPDQNLILLDDAPVYNASHLFGFFSVFNSSAIKNVQLTKAGFPARFGGRLSSVLEVAMKDGNMQAFEVEGSIGLVASQVTLQGPIRKDRTSFIVSARRTYIDLLIRPFLDPGERGGYFFYDVNAKVNHILSPRNRVFLSLYGGDDRFWSDIQDEYTSGTYRSEQTTAADFGWGNFTSTVRWNILFNNRLFGNLTGIFSRYKLTSNIDDRSTTRDEDVHENETLSLRYHSGIRDFGLKLDLDYVPNPAHYIRFGGNGTYHTYSPGAAQYEFSPASGAPEATTLGAVRATDALEFGLYLEDDVRLSKRMSANVGLHASGFSVGNSRFASLQPRVSTRLLLNPRWAFKASYARMRQYIHLLSNSTIGLPTDLWLPATERARPEGSRQFGVGLAGTLNQGRYELSLEAYHKTMTDLIEYREGATFLAGFGEHQDWQDKVETGRGWSYGVEAFVQRKRGRTTGWIGYTLSWTRRRFAQLNEGRTFPFRYDRRHDVALVLNHRLTRITNASLNWVYGTGNAVTIPVARYYDEYVRGSIGGHELWTPSVLPYEARIYEDRNGFRMSAYHRIDIGFNFDWRRHGFRVGAYNAYNRKNPFFIYFDDYYDSGTDSREYRAKQVTLFPVLPWISYRFKL